MKRRSSTIASSGVVVVIARAKRFLNRTVSGSSPIRARDAADAGSTGLGAVLLRGYEVDVVRSGRFCNGMPSDSDPAVYLSPPTLQERGGDELSLCRRRRKSDMSDGDG